MHLATLAVGSESRGPDRPDRPDPVHHGAFGCRRVIIQPDEKTWENTYINHQMITRLSPDYQLITPQSCFDDLLWWFDKWTGLDSGCGTKDASKKPSRNGHHLFNGYKGRAGHDGGGWFTPCHPRVINLQCLAWSLDGWRRLDSLFCSYWGWFILGFTTWQL